MVRDGDAAVALRHALAGHAEDLGDVLPGNAFVAGESDGVLEVGLGGLDGVGRVPETTTTARPGRVLR